MWHRKCSVKYMEKLWQLLLHGKTSGGASLATSVCFLLFVWSSVDCLPLCFGGGGGGGEHHGDSSKEQAGALPTLGVE